MTGVFALLVLASPSVSAQQITITPQLGAFVPLQHQSQWSWTDCCINGGDFTETLRTELSTAPSVGVKVEVDWGTWLGLQASVATMSPDQHIVWSASGTLNPPPPDDLSGPARTTVASLLVKFRKRLSDKVAISLGVGPSLVSLSQVPICGGEPPCIEDVTTFGPTLDFALGLSVTRRVRFDIAVVSNLYSVDYPEPPFPGREVDPDQSSFRQHDLMIFAGVGFVLKP